jgi:hypothetical protein
MQRVFEDSKALKDIYPGEVEAEAEKFVVKNSWQ